VSVLAGRPIEISDRPPSPAWRSDRRTRVVFQPTRTRLSKRCSRRRRGGAAAVFGAAVRLACSVGGAVGRLV